MTSTNIMFTFEIKIKDMNLLKEKLGVLYNEVESVLREGKERGYFSSQDMNYLLEKGFPIISMLNKNERATYKDKLMIIDSIKNGQVSYEDLIISLYNY